MKPPKTWRTVEQQIAKLLGLTRVGNTGKSTPDCMGNWLAVEVKHRRQRALPAWANAALQRVRGQAGSQRLGLLVIHQEGQRYSESVVCLTLADWLDWFGQEKPTGSRMVSQVVDAAAQGSSEAVTWLEICAPDALYLDGELEESLDHLQETPAEQAMGY